MRKSPPYFVLKLQERFEVRKLKNPRFSLRQYANSLGINSGTLSAILAGKRSLPLNKVVSVAKKLNLSKDEGRKFLESLNHPNIFDDGVIEISTENLESWEYSVILYLFRRKTYKASKDTVCAKTSIPRGKIDGIIEKLVARDILEVSSDGYISCKGRGIRIRTDWSTEESRHDQRKNLKLSMDNLESAPIEISKFTYQTICIDNRTFASLKKKLNKFWAEIEKLSDCDNNGHLHRISVAMFPLTKE